MRVAFTGGTGRIGRVVRRALEGRYEHVRILSPEPVEETFAHESVVHGDLRDLQAVEAAIEDSDIVVHLGGISDEADFEAILEHNVRGTYNVYEAARICGSRRVVLASSNHVIGFYPSTASIDTLSPVRPDTLYGVSKAFGEVIARLYYDKWGIESVCLRIGSFRPEPEDERQLSTWLSHRDGIELIARSIEAPDVGYCIVFGVSANTRSWWTRNAGADVIGFQPVDNAEKYASGFVDRPSQGLIPDDRLRQGGVFAEPEYRGGAG